MIQPGHRRIAVLLALVAVPLLSSILTARPSTAQTVSEATLHDNAANDAETILRRFTDAWRLRQQLAIPDTIRLGFRITGEGGGTFHAAVPPDGPVYLLTGETTAQNALVFEMDMATLLRIDSGQLNALTAMAQGHASDPTPLVAHHPPGFSWTPENRALYMPFMFHFWNREHPAVVRFGEGSTRSVHGAEATVLYYDRGFRSAWYRVSEGVHINADPRQQRNPFTSMFIITRGTVSARIDGIELRLSEGETLVVPAGMTHEFWAEPGEGGDAVVIMFGPGA
jgi:mannose-6-phosphate isomerase-like protein (cupin superfamily)